MDKKWTEKHRVEAWARIFELSAVAIREVADPIPTAVVHPSDKVGTESLFRKSLGDFDFNHARISREVRRVRALAEGRLVRETVWRSQIGKGCTYERAALEEARAAKRHNDAHGVETTIVRITRIRRVPS